MRWNHHHQISWQSVPNVLSLHVEHLSHNPNEHLKRCNNVFPFLVIIVSTQSGILTFLSTLDIFAPTSYNRSAHSWRLLIKAYAKRSEIITVASSIHFCSSSNEFLEERNCQHHNVAKHKAQTSTHSSWSSRTASRIAWLLVLCVEFCPPCATKDLKMKSISHRIHTHTYTHIHASNVFKILKAKWSGVKPTPIRSVHICFCFQEESRHSHESH